MKTTFEIKITEENLKTLRAVFSVHEAVKVGLTRLNLKRLTDARLIRMAKKIPRDGVETISGVVRIAGVERALVNAFLFSGKFTLQHAFYAARRAFADQKTTPEKLLSLARSLNLENCILKHWEALQFE